MPPMRRFALLAPLLLVACGDDGGSAAQTAYFDLNGATTDADTFWNAPFPSDLRLDSHGAPDLTGFPNRRSVALLNSLLIDVPDRRAWPQMSIAYFRFTADLPTRAVTDVITDGSVLLMDIDVSSPERGTTYPVVAQTLPPDGYVPSGLVAIAPRPGIVLRAATVYAYVVTKAFAPGFSAPPEITALANNEVPGGTLGMAAATIYHPLWGALQAASISVDDVLTATVFTTGDEVLRTRKRTEAIRAAYHPTIDALSLVGADTLDGFCHLSGTIKMPQFQVGTAPFQTDGRFVLDASDVPMKQGEMTIPLQITLPKTAMPAAGWPLYQFFHGSGGLSTGLVDLGHSPDAGDHPEPGKGPGYVVALHGIAAASSALPVNPERLANASDYAYLNINNLSAFPYTFQQGAIEQRLFLDALLALHIPQSVLAGCSIPAPSGGSHFFDPAKLVAGGQSMGGMYTNIIGATEGRYGALVPTGAGGFWNLMILETATIPGARSILSSALAIDDTTISFLHPALDVMAMGWEIAEPIVSMSRIAHRPLDGLTARHVYEPVGMGDTYFPTDVYDAAALAYGNKQAGDTVWGSMQDALKLEDLGGLVSYPVKMDHGALTQVVVQYTGDGIIDAHYLYRQNDNVKHQYGCFLESFLRDGVPTVPGPGAIDAPCP